MAAQADEREALAGWQLERASAEAYERYGVPAWSRALARGLLRIAAPGPGERLLDVACGTGIVARLATETVGEAGSVCGVDVNEAMLAVARDAGWGLRPPVDWRRGDAAALPVDDESVDVVTCQQALQFLPDREAALREMRRVLVPGGRLGLSVFRDGRFNPLYAAFAELLERHVGADAGTMMRSPVRGVGGGRPARTARRRRAARRPGPDRVRRRALPVGRRDLLRRRDGELAARRPARGARPRSARCPRARPRGRARRALRRRRRRRTARGPRGHGARLTRAAAAMTASAERSTSSSVVAQLETEMRIAAMPCQRGAAEPAGAVVLHRRSRRG